MKLAVMIEGQEGLNWERWRRLMEATERLGFEGLFRSDHFFSVAGVYGRDCIETWASLTLTAAETSRIRFGTLVSSMTFRHPALLARIAASIDQLSGGRLAVGVGAGWNVQEHEMFGLRLPPVKERLDRLEEGIQVMLALWAPGRANFEGSYYQLHEAEALPLPAQSASGGHPKLIVGGSGEKRTMLIAAKYADEWNGGGGPAPEDFRAKVAVLEAHCRSIGRDPATIERSRMLAFLIGRNQAEIVERARAVQESMPRLKEIAAAELPDRMRERGWLVGTPEQVIEQIRAHEAAGCQRIYLQHHDQTDFAVLELVAKEILPAVA
jgi:F420-dependent oxidoreductase-like protein